MKLKSPLIIKAELSRIEHTIKDLHEKIHELDENSPARSLYQMSLHEHMIRKSTLEWVIK